MKKTKKLLSLLLALVMLLTTISTVGMTAFAGYGDDSDACSFYFYLDRIPGVDGFPGQALDKSISFSAYNYDHDNVTSDLSNGGTTVSPDHNTIQPDTVYTYVIRLNYDGEDPLYYGYSGVTVRWNGSTYGTTYDAGHYQSSTSSSTYSKYGFTTPMTPSSYTPATVVEDELVYNGSTQRLLKDDEYLSSTSRIDIQYKVDDGIWVNDPSLVVAKDAGTHTIAWKASGVGYNSNIANEGTMTKEIKKLKVTVTPDEDQSKIYGIIDPTFTYTLEATNGAKVVPAVDVTEATGLFKNGALSRVEGENYTKNGYKYTIGTLQTANETNYILTLVDNTTVFMINRKDITAGGVDVTLEAPNGGFDGDIYQYKYNWDNIIQPAISLIYSGATVESIKNENLKLNKDYNVADGKTNRAYINHNNGNDFITLRGIGNYIGVTTLDWRVIKLNFGEITADKYVGFYDGEAHGITVNLTEAAEAADAEITYIYDADSDTVYNSENWDETKATKVNPTFKDVLVDESNAPVARKAYYRVHSELKDGGGSLVYNDFYGSATVLIKKKAVNLVANDKTKVYDKDAATDPALTYDDYSEQMIGTEVLTGVEISRAEGQNAGKYAISFNLADINLANTNYTVTETKGTFEITKRPVKVSVGDYEKIYSEVNPTLALTIEKDGEEGVAPLEGLLAGDVLTDETALGTTLAFIDENEKSWKYDRFIDAGKYDITKGTLANANYDITFTNGSFTVNQKDISLEDTNVVMLYNGSRIDPVFSYTGKTITPKFTMSDLQDEVEYVNYEEDIDFEVKGVYKASDYGIFNVSIKGIHNYKGEIFGKWAILPVIDKVLDYDGAAHSLEFNLGESFADGTVSEIRFSETEPTGEVTAESYDLTEVPSYTNAGVYTLYYGIVENPAEYGDAAGIFSGAATLVINKVDQAALTETNIPTAKELVYNTFDQALVTAPEELPEGCDHMAYSIDGGNTWTDYSVVGKLAGNYTVKVKYVGDVNHFDQNGEDINVTIAVATITPVVTLAGWTYGEEANEPVVTGNLDCADVTITYAVKGTENFTAEVPVNAGDYTVKAAVAATDNCTAGEATADFTIKKAELVIADKNKPAAIEGLVYTKSKKVLVTAPATLPEGCDHIEYSLDGETWTAEAPVAKEAGDYTVKVKYVGDANHFDKNGEDINVNIAEEGWYTDEATGLKYYYYHGETFRGRQVVDGKTYIFFKEDGHLLYGLVQCDNKMYIASKKTGELCYGMVKCDGKKYITDEETGELLYGKVKYDGKWYITRKTSGELLYGKVRCDGKWYIASKKDGHLFINQKVTCDGVEYKTDKNGVIK